MASRPYKRKWESKDKRMTLYHCDCRDMLPKIGHDAIITDPPYGIGFEYADYDDTAESWRSLMMTLHSTHKRSGAPMVIPACRTAELPWICANMPFDWPICWYKGSPGHRAFVGFNDWEMMLCYGKPRNFPIHDFFQTRNASRYDNNVDFHPCPKPVAWANWLVNMFSREGDLVVDPFMGSATVGVACANLNRRYVGMEMNGGYFDGCVERIESVLSESRLMVFSMPAFGNTKIGV